MKKFLLLFMALSLVLVAWAQERTVTGNVTSQEDGTSLPGVNILLKGTTRGAVTDANGSYSLSVPEAGGTLVFSFIGLVTQEIEIGQRTVIDITMATDVSQLSEVVVTALGIQREERSLGYAVQEVSSEDVNAVRSDNFLSGLSGRIAGVQIKNNTNFGGSNNVLIRGATSLTGNNQPLYVINGVPISNSNTNNVGQRTGRSGYDYGDAASDLNPNDIESYSVLKGAAATALYGSRAANGVIVITTKKGARKPGGGVGVTINSNVTFGKVDKTTFPDYQLEYGGGYGPYYSGGSYPYLAEEDVDGDGTDDLVVPLTEDASRGQKFDPSLMVYQYDAFIPESPYFGQARPWVAAANGPSTFFETAKTYSNSVDVTGGSDNASYRFSYTNFDESGIMPNSSLVRDNYFFTGSYNIIPKLRVTAQANFIQHDAKGRPSTGYSDNVLTSFRQWYQVNVDLQEQKELFELTNQNATWNPLATNDRTPIYWDNPYWVRYKNYETDSRDRLIGYAQLDWTINDNFSLMGRVAEDTYTELQEERKEIGSVAGELGVARPDVTSGYSRYQRKWTETNADLLLKFHHRFGELDLAGLVGTNIRRNIADKVFASTNGGLAVPGLYALNNSVDPMLPPEESLLESGVNGIFAQASLGYKDMIYVDASVRRDQSSTLPEDNNSYVYPSVSTSFVFSELANVSWMSMGKIRLNYAEVGNDAPPLSVTDTYRGNAPFSGNSLVTTYFAKNNPDLLPEKTKTSEAGLGMNFAQGRIGFDLAAYKSNTFNQLLPLSVSQATGYLQKWINAGEIENKGIELTVLGTPVRVGDFSWDIAINWAKNQNKVVYLYTDEAGNEVKNILLASMQGGFQVAARKGEPYGAILGTDYTYSANGERIISGTGRFVSTATNDIVIGNVTPDWTGGINNAFRYKDFSLSFLVDMQKGGDLFSLDLWYGISTGLYKETAGLNELGNPVRDLVAEGGGLLNVGVHADGTPNTTRVQADRYSADGYAVSPNARFVYDASFIKLREVVFTYTLPSSIIQSTPFAGASVSFVGSNLWIIDKNLPHADPEASQGSGNYQGWQSGVMPTVRNFGFSVKLQF